MGSIMAYLKYTAWYIALHFLVSLLGDIANTKYLKTGIVLAINSIDEDFMSISKIFVEKWANFDFDNMQGDSLYYIVK